VAVALEVVVAQLVAQQRVQERPLARVHYEEFVGGGGCAEQSSAIVQRDTDD
jgi:hypothetical protein